MTIRSLPERCCLFTVEHDHGDGERHGDEWHSLGGDGSHFFEAVAELWSRAAEDDPVPLPYLADRPCLVLSCSWCRLVYGQGEGEHFAAAEEAVAEAAGQGWVGELCGWCVGRAGAGSADSLDDPPRSG